MAQPIIEARDLAKFFRQPDGGRIEVIAPTNLAIYPGTIVALLGPSGSGKSTLLRLLSGLTRASTGEVFWHGRSLDGYVPNVAIVFQSFALFPWLTVLENVEAPLKALAFGAVERRKRALKMLDTVGLDGFETAYPKELSGGMKQRVGIARALVVEPEVLFMDEPLSSLDVLTAENLRSELLDLWLSNKIPTRTMFLVTHNIEEAALLADRIIVLGRNPGRIRADFPITLPQPRDRKSSNFIELIDYTYKILTQPDLEQAFPLHSPGAGIPAPTLKFQMLPHARPGSIAGLLELLADRGGRDDLYHLADELSMEVDDLLPSVEAAVLLGFAKLAEGDTEITAEGREFVEADILNRKVLFREAAVKKVSILRQIDSVLHTKSDHTIQDELFHDILDKHFSEHEAQRQFETALHWGRYGEIFDYDSDSGRLFLPESTAETGTPSPLSGK
jgi:NitT/TauT family transport system ATP-binding protein